MTMAQMMRACAVAVIGLCLLSASTGNARTTFYAGMVALLVWALWSVRSRGGSMVARANTLVSPSTP